MIHLGDIAKINGAEIPIVDVITGGSPCQDLSVAGQRAGLDGERSGLFMEQIRIVKEMREHDRRANNRTGEFIRPRYMVWENVPGAFSSNKGHDFQTVLTEIIKIADPESDDVPMPEKGKWPHAGCIYDELGRWSVAWRLHDAQFWGVPQRRKRIALVADFGGLSASEILFERKGLQWHPDESEQTGEETSRDSGNSTSAASYTLKVRGGVERDSYGKRAGKGALIQTEKSGTLGVSQDQTLFALEGNGSRPSHSGDGYKETDKMYTLNTIEQHGVCLNGWDVQSKHIQPEDGVAETLYSGEKRYGGGESYVAQGYGVTTKGNGDAFINKDTHTSLSNGGGQAGQGYPCVLTEEPLCIGNGQENEAARPEKVSKPLNCLDDRMKVLCVGNGQLAQAKLSEKVGALNCMHDQQAVLEMDGVDILNKSDSQGNQVANDDGTYPTLRGCGGAGYQQGYCLQKNEKVLAFDRAAYNQDKNAQYDFSVEEDVAQPIVAKDPSGVTTDDSVHDGNDPED